MSFEQSYTLVYVNPANIDVKRQLQGEALSLWNGDASMSGDDRYNARNNPVGLASDYNNPHTPRASSPRAGSGPRP